MSGLIDFGLPILFVVFVWWASTGLILFLNELPEWSYRTSLSFSFILAVVGFLSAFLTRSITDVSAAYIGFSAAITIWGFIEMALLMGVIAGPSCAPGRPKAAGWERLKGAASVIAYHEIALVAALALLGWTALGGENCIAPETFGLLWIMRLSAKVNIFLGVTNASPEFLPPRVAYLATHFRSAPMNAIFPVSVIASIALIVALAHFTVEATPNSMRRAGFEMLAALAALGLLEHVLLMLPIKLDRLWSWGLGGRRVDVIQGSPGA